MSSSNPLPHSRQADADQALRKLLEGQLRPALVGGQFSLHYQPKVDLDSGKITGAEALVRWRHPDLGWVSPELFLEIAEASGSIAPLGEWILRQACRQLAEWRQAGIVDLQMAVNLSASQFNQPGLSETIVAILCDAGVEPKWLALEFTEAFLIRNVDDSIRAMRALRAAGISLALDDFGTGVSSLSFLSRFPVNTVKIDQVFIADVTSNPNTAAVVRSIVGMARALRLRVVAEGVETQGQLNFLRRHDCDAVQGYFICKPVAGDQFLAFIRQFPGLPPRRAETESASRTLLLVDDEINILNALKRQLRGEGYRILTAASAQEGFEHLANHAVGVIVSDQRMAEMSGSEFLRRVKQLYPQVMRIVLSGYSDFQSITEAINQGAIYKFLSKPWEETLLRDTLREAFEHFELARENAHLSRALRDANDELSDRHCQLPAQVLEQLPLPVIGIDGKRDIVLANQQARRLFGEDAKVPLLGAAAASRLPESLSDDARQTIDIAGNRYRRDSFRLRLADDEITVLLLRPVD